MRRNRPDRRGTSLQAPPRQSYYPRWGECPQRTSNAHSLYRYGDVGIWTRFIIAPREGSKWLYAGVTIGDVVILLAVLAFCGLLSEACAAAFDRYLDSVGY